MSHESARRSGRRPEFTRADPRPADLYDRLKLFRNGRHLWPVGGKLCAVARSRSADARRTSPAWGLGRVYGVQQLSNANGGRRRQADFASNPIPRVGVRADATVGGSTQNRRRTNMGGVHGVTVNVK